jgi:hypothetical protein
MREFQRAINDLKTTIAEGVIACEIRKRSVRVQVHIARW